MTDTEVWQFIRMDETPTILFPKFPCHTLAVERLVKVVTEASKNACVQIHEMASFVLGLLLDT